MPDENQTEPTTFSLSESLSAIMAILGRADATHPGPGFKTINELAELYDRSVPWASNMVASLRKRKIPVESRPWIIHNPATGSRRRTMVHKCHFWANAPVAPSNDGLPDSVE